MKTAPLFFRMLLLAAAPLLTDCSLVKQAPLAAADLATTGTSTEKPLTTGSQTDELDDYSEVSVGDPLEGFNRATFKMNDALYTVFFRPVSKGYEFIFPKPLRSSLDNAFENARYPVRFVNSTLQGKFKRAGRETGKFFVNTIFGLGGLFKTSDKIPDLTDVPAEDTGQTLATSHIPHGP
jgi:phospholipid-binding lipoprotein MlaA